MGRKKICILASMGWGVRNILMSRAMEVLREQAEIHVFSAFSHLANFRKRFAQFTALQPLYGQATNYDTRAFHFYAACYYHLSHSRTHKHKLQHLLQRLRRPAWRRALPLMLAVGGPWLFRGAQWYYLRELRACEAYRQYRQYFKAHGIDTLVSANPFNANREYPAILAASDAGIRTLALITSWDAISSKRPQLIPFNEYLVWGRYMQGEVQRYYAPGLERIHQIGPIQFDYYCDPRYFESRSAFCARYNLEPQRKIVVHSTVTPNLMPDEPDFIRRLLEARRSGHLHGDPNILIRLHPKRRLADFQHLMQDPRWQELPVGWSTAGTPYLDYGDQWCPLDDEIRLLVNTVRHGDVNLNLLSTMLLDFSMLGKPVVLIAHNAQDQVVPYLEYEHLQPVLRSQACLLGYNFTQTLQHLNTFLQYPQARRQQRDQLLQLYGVEFLGNSWQHFARILMA